MGTTNANAINFFSAEKWVVSKVAGEGTHTTISSAISDATSGDTIVVMPGTYTENLTLKSGVSLVSYVKGVESPAIITGKMIDNGSVISCIVQGFSLTTNSDNFLALTGASSNVSLVNCYLNMATTGMNCGSGCTVRCFNCTGDITTTSVGIFTGAASFQFIDCVMTNSGSSTTASTSSGLTILTNSTFASPFSTSSSGTITIRNTTINCSAINTTAVTTAGTGSSISNDSAFFSGTASAISIGSGTTFTASSVTVSSTNTNAVTGAGTLVNGGISFINTSSLINTTTQTARNFNVGGLSFDGGTNTMAAYIVSTFTPAINFGGGSTGITYSTQSGNYILIGKLLMLNLNITLTNKGSSTGTATVVGFPSYVPAFNSYAVIRYANLSGITGGTAVAVVRNNAGTMDALIQFITNAAAATNLTDTAFANNTGISITAFVQVT